MTSTSERLPSARPLGEAADATALPALAISPEEATRARRLGLRGAPRDVPRDGVWAAVMEWARRTPDSPAVLDAVRELTWSQVVDEVAALRARLEGVGIRPGDVVAVHGPRTAGTVTAFLTLDAVGSVYLPVDASWPAERVATVVRDAGVRVLVTTSEALADRTCEVLGGASVQVVRHPGEVADGVKPRADGAGPVEGSWARPQYVIYTSGTTGTPKGAVVERRGMLNHLVAKVDDLDLTERDVVAFTAPVAFDIAIWQMVCGLVVGGRVVVLDDLDMSFPSRLVSAVARHEVTVLELVPTVIGFLVEHVRRNPAAAGRLARLRWLISTGEELHPPLAAAVTSVLPDVRLLNAYGPTECSDDVTHHVVSGADLELTRLPVGAPVCNTSLYLLVQEDEQWRAADHGEVAELFVGGLGVGAGYLGNRGATEAAFSADPLDATSETGRLYRTGDLATVHGGDVHYLGRRDRQVKVAGVRMELDEVEAVLKRHEDVAHCAVVARGAGAQAELVAHVVSVSGHDRHQEWQTFLRERVPPAMVPRHWRVVPSLPLTTHGKVDHRKVAENGAAVHD